MRDVYKLDPVTSMIVSSRFKNNNSKRLLCTVKCLNRIIYQHNIFCITVTEKLSLMN